METNGDEATVTDGPDRRRFLAMGAAAATLLGGRRAEAQRQPPVRGRGVGPLPAPPSGSAPEAGWKDPVLRLVRRVTLGMTPDDVALARQLGYSRYLDQQLRWSDIDDSATEELVAARMPLTLATPQTLSTANGTEVENQLQDQAMFRAAFSKRQLRERLVEFWTDHFTISLTKVGYLKMVDDREVIRRHALGKFPDLLRASAHSGAMLVYLDQNRSRTPTPNQNYAREIMELHTLGVDGGYTQADVEALSRILTGWTTTGPGTFSFNRTFHDRGEKVFLGRTFPAMASTASDAAMKGEGDAAIEMLLAHPSTARYVPLKLARWLLAYEPPAAVVDAASATWTRTGGDIAEVVRTILSRPYLMAAPAKYKRPFHFAVSSLRATGAEVANIRAARQRADQMGMPMFRWEQPNGYPDRIDWWSGLAIQRWSFATYVATQNSATAMRVNTALFRTPQDTPEGVVGAIDARMFGGEMPAGLRQQLATYLRGGTYNDTRIRETIALALSAHQFQWY